MKKNVRQYTEEFRQQALKLAEELDSVKEASKQLGIPEANIYVWRSRSKGASPDVLARPKASKLDNNEDLIAEIERLRRENSRLNKVNYILKSAAAFFSQDHLK